MELLHFIPSNPDLIKVPKVFNHKNLGSSIICSLIIVLSLEKNIPIKQINQKVSKKI